MSNDVVLGSALRTNLLSLQRTQSGIDKIQNILATGLKVSSALDNPQNFFAAKGLNDRASDLTRLLDGIGQSISTIKAADKGSAAIGKLIDQAESIAASAAEEAANGTTIAKITGEVDLRGITDITSLTGVSAGDQLKFSYIDKDGTTLVDGPTSLVTLSAGDSIDEVIAKINDLGAASATSTAYGQGEVFRASLDSNGYLQIQSKTGGSFRLVFEAGTADVAEVGDQSLGAALGFGNIARQTFSGGTNTAANFEVTALASNKLTSGVLYEAGGAANGIAEASDLLTSTVTTLGGATARFAFNAADNPALNIQVNGVTEVTFAADSLDTLTIQGFVDGVNTSSKIRASYDETTGELSIESLDPEVKSIQVQVDSSAATEAATVDFDFGIKANLNTAAGAANYNQENFVFGAANAALADLQNDYNTVRESIDQLVSDAGYRGVNLLQGDTLTTFFNEGRTNSLATKGRDLTVGGLGLKEANFSSATGISAIQSQVLAAKEAVRSFGTAIANSLSIVQTREDFTKDMVAELTAGADKLTVADQNEEGAKLLALQTRQQLGVTSLSLAVQSQQSVLRLF